MGKGILDFVAISLPEKKPGIVHPLELGVSFTNKTSLFLFFKDLVPQLVAPDGQILKRKEPDNKGNSWKLITPGLPVGIVLKGKISWHDTSLQLEIPTYSYHSESPPIATENSWKFDDLRPGIYKLKFICDILVRDNSFCNSQINLLSESEEIVTHKLETNSLNLHLFEPLEVNNHAVKIDNIQFKTILSKKVLTIPKQKKETRPPLNFAGISITNNTLNPINFSFYITVIPEIIGTDGQILFRSYFSDWSRQAENSDFVLAMPGENIIFFPSSALQWQHDDHVQLSFSAEDGGVYTFELTGSGTYKIQLNYVNTIKIVNVYNQEAKEWKKIENIWTGMVTTPFVDFKLM
ncbi:MAG: hypothetical protein EAZ87_08335 [Nostocales cyanobacterium]|nr:MAG: hypothetical protein EAZ87_08335 [Nostocales cyanobacterium]